MISRPGPMLGSAADVRYQMNGLVAGGNPFRPATSDPEPVGSGRDRGGAFYGTL